MQRTVTFWDLTDITSHPTGVLVPLLPAGLASERALCSILPGVTARRSPFRDVLLTIEAAMPMLFVAFAGTKGAACDGTKIATQAMMMLTIRARPIAPDEK